jgi:hypothetical protein
MIYPCKLNIYLNFQRLSADFGERVANGNRNADSTPKKIRISFHGVILLLKPVDTWGVESLDFLDLRAARPMALRFEIACPGGSSLK